jgi:hypothetical protein
MAQTKTGAERRRAPRIWVRSRGQVIVVRGMRGTRTLDCIILNKSTGGALVQVEDASLVPNEFYLTFEATPQRKHVCTVVRRSKRLLAVRYEPQASHDVSVRRISSY